MSMVVLLTAVPRTQSFIANQSPVKTSGIIYLWASPNNSLSYTFLAWTHSFFKAMWLYFAIHTFFIIIFLNLYLILFLNFLLSVGEERYCGSEMTPGAMLRLLAVARQLIMLLGNGLSNFSLACYRQLNKRLGKVIRYSRQGSSGTVSLTRDQEGSLDT